MLAPVDEYAGQPADVADRFSLDAYPCEHPAAVASMPSVSVPEPSPLAAVETFVERDGPPRVGDAYRGKVITSREVSVSAIEQYRRFAAALHPLQTEQGLRSVTVTSSVPREGKTLTIVNLAMMLSESYKRRVLLIDADLRRPAIHDAFGISNSPGLCEALRSASGTVTFAHVSSRLSVLPAGSLSGDPMTALASPRMPDLLEAAASEFDWILLDAPPVALMADAGLLVRLTRAVVLVIAAGSTPYTVVEKAVADLGREHIVGTVLNRAEDAPAGAPYYPDFRADAPSKG